MNETGDNKQVQGQDTISVPKDFYEKTTKLIEREEQSAALLAKEAEFGQELKKFSEDETLQKVISGGYVDKALEKFPHLKSMGAKGVDQAIGIAGMFYENESLRNKVPGEGRGDAPRVDSSAGSQKVNGEGTPATSLVSYDKDGKITWDSILEAAKKDQGVREAALLYMGVMSGRNIKLPGAEQLANKQ